MKMKTSLLLMTLLGISGNIYSQSLWDKNHLESVKHTLNAPFYSTAYQHLISEADQLLEAEPLSVMMKEKTPASGNKHDYMSQARYFWPDPNQPDGLPYINKDGKSNPELEKLDRNKLGETAQRITTLSLAWYFSENEKYAQKATELAKVWFLNKDTYMNPNLEYAQIIPGVNNDKGRCYGVLDSYSFVEMLDALTLLEESEAFTSRDSKQIKKWFSRLLDWLTTSPQGKEEALQKNNHGTAYDALVIAFALYTGNQDLARKIINELPEKRIFTQIEPDGKQPYELKRTLAFGYSQYNLTHFIDIFQMAKKLDIQIDGKTSSDGRNFYKAMDFLQSFVDKEVTAWPYQQISGWDEKKQAFCKDLYRTYLLNPARTDYLQSYKQNTSINFKERFNLLYVRATEADNVYAFADQQLRLAIECTHKAKKEKHNAIAFRVSPRSINKDGSLSLVSPYDWCSGFFPGSLWQMYAYTHDNYWRRQAISFTWPIEEAQWHKGTHDLGFMMNNSFGKGYELTGEQSYLDVVLQSAQTLTTRYNDKVKCIRSWDHNRDKWRFPVIIDNLMNLELLFEATILTGDSTYWNIAVNHANTTMKNHFRPDYSSYHVVDYVPETGEINMKCTAQGYSDDSYWSRGQAWGLYGYTMCYRFTHDPAYLKQAENIADFFLKLPNMPNDLIPYWDMKTPETEKASQAQPDSKVPRDASAAAVIASGLYELSQYVGSAKSTYYKSIADQIVHNLSKHYQAEPGTTYGFLLKHSTGHLPADSEIDVPLCYADYYYLEALLRKDKLDNKVQ